MPSATTRTAGTDALDKELDTINATLADHEARLKKLESSQSTQPPTQPPTEPPPVEQPPSGGGGGFVWQGVNTKWPTAATTGPRVALTSSSKMSYGTAGETVSAKKFNGKVIVTAHDVKFIDCEFTNATDWGCDADMKRVTFEYCRFTGGGTSTSQKGAAILGVAKVKFCDISKFEDGIKLQGNDVCVEDCYIHDPLGAPEGHFDGIQVSGSNDRVSIQRNSITWKDTSCVFNKPDWGPVLNVTVKHNRLEGGGYRVYFDARNYQVSGSLIENLLVAGGYDYAYISDSNANVQVSGNINQSGQAINPGKSGKASPMAAEKKPYK
jgi:hypothetical protein